MKQAKVIRPSKRKNIFPVACIQGKWLPVRGQKLWEQRNPSHWRETIGYVSLATAREVAAATAVAFRAQQRWKMTPPRVRRKLLLAWRSKLLDQKDELAWLMALEIGKPVSLGHQEIQYAAELLQVTASILGTSQAFPASPKEGFSARRRPVGVIGIITPWNNPVAIPAGSLAPAIGFGNAVVWKPPLQAPRAARLMLGMLNEAGCPDGLVNLIFGDARTAEHLILQPNIRAISFTGSYPAGRRVAALAGRQMKPVQLELGGNNGAIIMPDCDLNKTAGELAISAFSFAGQRCTAPRRFIVHRHSRKRFEEALLSSIQSLRLGLPQEPLTQIGPLISKRKQGEMRGLVKSGLAAGAKLLCGGKVPDGLESGCWFEPTLLYASNNNLPLLREESFGPIAILQVAHNLDEALSFLNGVPQGLVASLYTRDRACQKRFLETAECGVLKLNQTTLGVEAEAPFGGWKTSGLGPPKHGVWDQDFCTLVQALYD